MLEMRLHSAAHTGSPIMGKIRQGNKEAKKPAAMTPKAKKAAKAARKHAHDIVPLIVPR